MVIYTYFTYICTFTLYTHEYKNRRANNKNCALILNSDNDND